MILDGRKLVEILPLSDLYTVYKEHNRLKVFVHKGRHCVVCDREGVFLLVTQEKTNKKGKRGKLHVDLYDEDFVLMTVDHITPKAICKKAGWSRAARERLTNKQTMCSPCNAKKDSKPLTVEQMRELIPRPIQKGGTELVRQFVHNPNIFNRSLSF